MHEHLLQRARDIRLAIFDVDGVLTDGRLYFLTDGSEFKTFNTLDGHGIKMLINSGVRTAIISGRKTPVVERRAQNLGIQHLYQGREDKLVVLDELLAELGLSYSEVAYLGDDLPDLPVIRRVGLGMAVASADDAITGVTGSALKPDNSVAAALAPSTTRVPLTRQTSVNLTDAGIQVSSPKLTEGLLASVTITFSQGEPITLQTPVVSASHADFSPAAPTPIHS